MKCEICGEVMRDMGHWPDKDFKFVINRYHCAACESYAFTSVPDVKLVRMDDGSFEEVAT